MRRRRFNRKDPLISPLFADLSGFPPTLIQVGSSETLLDDAVRFARAAGLADVNVTLEDLAAHDSCLADVEREAYGRARGAGARGRIHEAMGAFVTRLIKDTIGTHDPCLMPAGTVRARALHPNRPLALT